MIPSAAFALCLACNPYLLTFPTEKVCERQFKIAEAHYNAVAEMHALGGAGRCSRSSS